MKAFRSFVATTACVLWFLLLLLSSASWLCLALPLALPFTDIESGGRVTLAAYAAVPALSVLSLTAHPLAWVALLGTWTAAVLGWGAARPQQIKASAKNLPANLKRWPVQALSTATRHPKLTIAAIASQIAFIAFFGLAVGTASGLIVHAAVLSAIMFAFAAGGADSFFQLGAKYALTGALAMSCALASLMLFGTGAAILGGLALGTAASGPLIILLSRETKPIPVAIQFAPRPPVIEINQLAAQSQA